MVFNDVEHVLITLGYSQNFELLGVLLRELVHIFKIKGSQETCIHHSQTTTTGNSATVPLILV